MIAIVCNFNISIHISRAMISGGGAPEIEIAQKLAAFANTTPGLDQYCFRAFADAFEVIPYTLAENAGLSPVQTVTELRALHAKGEKNAGINVRTVIGFFCLIADLDL